MRLFCSLVITMVLLLLTACDLQPWNNPYPKSDALKNIYYASFNEAPKTLDPARSYSADEALFIGQIYEPILQYHYLKRPYTLEPLTAARLPEIHYFDKNNLELSENAPVASIAYTTYDITIKPGIYYQLHPAFARDSNGHYYYHALTTADLKSKKSLKDFIHRDTRELVAADYVYEIKRLADPTLKSPIFSTLSDYVLEFDAYSKRLGKIYEAQQAKKHSISYVDLRQHNFSGVKILDRYRYRIIVKGKYPQFIYWLAMPFFAPIPWEADYFYSQPGMRDKNLTWDWYPVGTGAYILAENNPNREMVLERNPNFHPDFYPTTGEEGDVQKGFLKDAGKKLPFIDKFVFTLEKESIPRWNKFLQGYYDASAISPDSFDQAVYLNAQGQPQLTPEMLEKNIVLQTSIGTNIHYFGFNMLDDVVGGSTEPARKLRLAISIAFNIEEYIALFLNGRGISAQGPLPPGIFGYQSGEKSINPYVYDVVHGKLIRKPLSEAKRLLTEAGYPNGINPKTDRALLLNYEVASTENPDEKSQLEWVRKQFAQLNIQLNIRSTTYNRFQEKVRNGNAQLFFWGWSADYPDPENFLFLLYGPNGKVKYGGENAANYMNANFDQLFLLMKDLPDGETRQKIIDRMLEIVRHDSPWIWGFYPKDFVLHHAWVQGMKPNEMAQNTLKYAKLDPKLRAQKRLEWNQPIVWPFIILLLLFILLLVPVFNRYWHKEHDPHKKNK